MHAADDGVYHVQLQGTIPTCTFIIQRNVSLDQPAPRVEARALFV